MSWALEGPDRWGLQALGGHMPTCPVDSLPVGGLSQGRTRSGSSTVCSSGQGPSPPGLRAELVSNVFGACRH